MVEYSSLEDAWESEILFVPTTDEHCSLCLTAYSLEDQPVSSVGPQSCAHVFGSFCLWRWFKGKDHAICPMCRQLWFTLADNADALEYDLDDNREDDEDDEVDNENNWEQGSFGEAEEEDEGEDWAMNADSPANVAVAVEHLHERETAAVLVSALYCEFRNTENNVSDKELKEVVKQALLDSDLYASVPVSDTLWAQMRGMSVRMLRDSKQTDWDDHVEQNWIRRLKRALNLTFNC